MIERLEELFAAQAAATPGRTAVTFEGHSLTYHALDAAADGMAAALAARGAARGRYVALVLPRSLDLVVAVLAALKTGAAYVPLEPDYPDERIGNVVEDARPALAVTTTEIARRLTAAGVDLPWLLIDEPTRLRADVPAVIPAEAPSGCPALVPAARPAARAGTADDPAYVIFTSGSTGRPKGVVIPHRNVVRLFSSTAHWYGFGPDDVWPLFHSIAFDVSVWELWGALLHGGRLVVVPRPVTRAPQEYLRLLVRERVTVLNQTPSAFYQLMAADRDDPTTGARLRLRYAIFAGEALDLGGLAGWYERHADDAPTLVNMYGITETTVHASFLALDRRRAAEATGSAIGVPIPDLRFHVLDGGLREVAPGESGELYVSGPGLATGYANRPGLTAERFVACPSSPSGARMYRSGDLVRRTRDGGLEYLRRNDDQVKIRGFRVEPAEIEGVLAADPAVAQAVVIPREDRPGERRLVAYLVPAGPSAEALSPSRLRASLARRLPGYMIPAAFHVMERFPLTVNGKLDRRALPPPSRADSVDADYVAPRDDTESLLAGIWRQVLGIERVGAHDSFFDLGGDSLSATRVLSRIRAVTGVALPPATLFETPTIAGLTGLLTGTASRPVSGTTSGAVPGTEPGAAPGVVFGTASGGVPGTPPVIPPVPRIGPLPLSATQRRFWLDHQLHPGEFEYNVHTAHRLHGELDMPALRRALRELAARHEPLRTTVADDGGEPVGVLADPDESALPCAFADLSALPPREREAALEDLLRAEAATPFDLARGPVARALLVRLAGREHVLALGVHHMAVDGWSLGVIHDELAELYDAARNGRASGLPPLPVGYVDYAAAQREELDAARLEPRLRFWRDRLAGLAPLDLPGDRPRPPVRGSAGGEHRFAISGEPLTRLREFGRARGATLFMTLVAAGQVLLARYGGVRDVAVGTVVSGRDRPELERLVGSFVNTVVLRSTVDETLPVAGHLDAVKQTVLSALAHQDVPFDLLVEDLGVARDPGRTPLVQAVIVLQNAPAGDSLGRFADLRSEPVNVPRTAAVFDLTLEFTERGDTLEARIEYGSGLFDPATIERLAGHLRVLLEELPADPARPVGALGLLTGAERATILRDWATSARAAAPPRCVHHQLAEQAAARPRAVAVGGPVDDATDGFIGGSVDGSAEGSVDGTDGDGELLSYAELNERANRLAHHLRALGVRRGTPVVLRLERKPVLVVAMAAVLKAGGAFVPTDPAMPDDRLAHIVRETGAQVMIASDAAPVRDGLTVLDPVAARHEVARRPAHDPDVAVGPDDLAYIVYTSGSTGRPKGAMIPHRGLSVLCSWHSARFGVEPGDRASHLSGLGFDATVWEIWPYLCAGARVDQPAQDVLDDPAALVRWFERRGTTVCFLPTPRVETVLGGPGVAETRLRAVLTGGDVLRVVPRTGIRLVNAYGPSESAVVATSAEVDVAAPGPPPIGGPVDGTAVYVLDRAGTPVPCGVPGELYLAGAGLARGYAGRPDLTAERFVACPFGPPGSRVYRTGDLVRWRPDGTLDFLGRTDDQIQLRGHRVEPGEIEHVLDGHPSVARSVVTAVGTRSGGRRLVAHVVPAGTAPIDPGELAEHAAGTLPAYMVPAAFVRLDRLPLTPNGKIDKAALPVPEHEDDDGAYVPPATPVERLLAGLWADALGVRRVGRTDNFFALGGDSILSLRVVAGARRAGLRLTSQDLFRRQTIAALAPLVGAPAPATPGAAPGPAPLTPIQRWYFVHLGEARLFHQYVVLELAAGVEEAALRAALAVLAERHEALRSRFDRAADGTVTQDITGPPPAFHVAATAMMTEAELTRVLRTTEGVAAAVLFPGKPPKLALAVHHLAVDGVSWRVIIDDLERAYRAVAAGRPADLGGGGTLPGRWAARLAEHARAGGFDDQAEFWERTERDVTEALGRARAGEVRQARSELDAAHTEALLRDVPEVYRTEINDVLLTALSRALAEWTGEPRVSLALEGHGREEIFEDVDLSRTVGWFTGHYPVVLDAPAVGTGWGAALKSVKEQLRAIPRRGVGYGALRYTGTAPGGPVPAVAFNYLGRFDRYADRGGPFTAVSPVELLQDPATPFPHDVEIVGRVVDGRLEFTWRYDPRVCAGPGVERLAERFGGHLRAIVAHCAEAGAGGRTPSDFPGCGLDQEALDRLVGDGRHVEDVYPLTPMQSGLLFHSLMDPEQATYQEQLRIDLRGVRAPELLETAWRRVAARTPVLRTRLAWDGLPEPCQVVQTAAPVVVTPLDWTGTAEQDRRRYLHADRHRPFDLGSAPLMRVTAAALGGDRVRLIWTFHHILLDGWSATQILSEVLGEYAALADGTPFTAPPHRPFADYVRWLGGRDTSRAETYWRDALAGMGARTPLPFDRPRRDDHRAGPAAEHTLRLPAGVTARLYAAARRAEVTIGTVLQGVWALLLSRHAGERMVCFGETATDRPETLEAAQSIIGLLITTLPVRVEVDEDAELAEWLRRLQRERAHARGHAAASPAQVRSWTLERGDLAPSDPALFDSVLVVENYPADTGIAARYGFTPRRVTASNSSNFPLNAIAYADDRLTVLLHYDTDLFDAATVERLAGRLETLLTAVADNPGARIADLPVLTPAERRTLLEDWPVTAEPGGERRMDAEIAAVAERHPTRVAIEDGEHVLTYGELDRYANRLARRLVAAGVGRNDVVGVLAGRGIEVVVAILGVLKAGAGYLPLDPDFPPPRLAEMVAQARCALLLAQEGLLNLLPADGIPVLRLRPYMFGPQAAPPVDGRPGDLAYVTFTSGSTGQPKGVMIEHRALANVIAAARHAYGLDESSRVLQFYTMSFDGGVWEVFKTLSSGGTLVIADRDARQDPARLTVQLRERAITALTLPPAVAAALDPGRLPALTVLGLGGDVLTPELAAVWAPGRRLVNIYGPSETALAVTLHPVPARAGAVPLGRPIPGVRLYVLDARLRPVPVGVRGELYIGGAGVGRGYLNRPGPTASSFVADPFGPPGGRLYRTGDMVRWNDSGELEFSGRADDQVKIRGYRVEPAEVENALLRLPEVAEAVVTAVTEGGHRRLAAYVVPARGARPERVAVREALAATLPDYMVSAAVVPVAELPLGRTGKVDRAALPAVDWHEAAPAYVPPRTPTEEALAAIWADLLGVARVGATDDLFVLGGDSITTLRLMARVGHAFGVEVSPRELFDHPTVAELAAIVEDKILAELAEDPASGVQGLR